MVNKVKFGGSSKAPGRGAGLVEAMFTNADKYHGLHMVDDSAKSSGARGRAGAPAKGTSGRGRSEDEDMEGEFEEDIEPVFDLGANDDDDDGDDDDDDAASDEEEEEGGDGDEKAEIANEDKILSGWGKKKAAFYDADSDVEIDEDAAAAEEEEAIRLQRVRASELDEEDIAFGVSALQARRKPGTAAAPGKAGGSRASATLGASGSAVERLPRDARALSAGLSKQAKMDILTSDAPELVGLLQELKERTAEVRDVLTPILRAVSSGALPTGKGVGYLEVKHALLLSYITDIAFVLLLRAEGKSVREHPVVAQLVHVRTLLERMRPLDARLGAQVARLLQAAHAAEARGEVEGNAAEAEEGVDYSEITGHPAVAARAARAHLSAGPTAAGLSARPNPSALLAHGDKVAATALVGGKKGGKAEPKAERGRKALHVEEAEEEAEVEAEEEDALANVQGVVGKDGVFRPLRRSAVPFDGDKPSDKAARDAERRAARASRSALLADITAVYSSAPEVEDTDGGGGGQGGRTGKDDALAALASEREAYEEDMLTRVTMSKTEKRARKARETEKARWNSLQDLEALGDLDELTRAVDAQEAERTMGGGGKAKGGARSLSQLEAETKARQRTGGAVAHAAASGMASAVGRKKTGAAGASALELDADDGFGGFGDDDGEDEAEDGGRGGRSRKRGRGEEEEEEGGEEAGGGGEDEDFYAAIVEAAAAKKAKKAAAGAAFDEERKTYLRNRVDPDALADPSAHRKASRFILANRGLVKYRKREERNPRVHNRMKADKFLKRRKGQVVPMRDKGAEEGRYGGETTGIRTGVSRSRKIQG